MADNTRKMFAGLNPAQTDAVTSAADVLQILAPPGSGKTKTLTSRVAYLLNNRNYKPWNIICLTFTIKSAREMRDRISRLLGDGTERKLVLGTFHSVCRRYLVSYGHLIGIAKGFGIADSSDTLSIIKRITKRHKFNLDPKKAQGRISHTKSKGLSVEDVSAKAATKKNVEQQEFVTIFEEYERQLASSNLLDYDDLLVRCVDLLRNHPQCVSNVEAVLIDEFQDTNVVQFELMTLFADRCKRVTTVGDMDQSIYGWRSAEIENLNRMQSYYSDTVVINLQENYRSSGAILLCANEVIEQDSTRTQKAMLPTHCLGSTPCLRRLPSADIEAAWIVSELKRCRALTGELFTFSDFAVLLRSASLSRLIESAMGRAGIPYRMVGGHRFYDRVEVKILLDYLRVVSQTSNNDAVARVMNVPARGIGEATVKSLLEDAEISNSTLWTSLSDVVQGYKATVKVSKSADTGIGSFRNLVMSCRNALLRVDTITSPEDILRLVIKRLDFKAYLERCYPEDFETRWLNVEELVSQASDHCPVSENVEVDDPEESLLPEIDGVIQDRANPAEEALSRFLANVALTTEIQRENQEQDETKASAPQHQVTISTIHAAKGLEWPVVFVPSAYDGCIPHSRADDTDEERRLLYVAMTRAQALLYTSCPMKNSQREESTLSPFLSEPKVLRMLSKQGPSIDTSSVLQIASILGRQAPSDLEIQKATVNLEHREDDRWSLDGSESIEIIQARLARFADSDSGRWKQGSSRRKHEEVSIMTPELSAVGFTTTMQGFVKASEHLQTMPPIAEAPIRKPVEKERPQKKPKIQDTTSKAANIHNFFAPRSIQTKNSAVEQTSGHSTPSSAQMSAHSSRQTSIAAQSKELVKSTEQIYHVIKPSNREHELPSTLSAPHRRIRNGAMTGQPFSTSIEEASRSSGFLFLSSPPPSEAEEPPGKKQTEAKMSSSVADRDKENLKPESKEVMKAQQPAASRRTLGTKRSLGGWASRGQSAFAPPRLLNRHST